MQVGDRIAERYRLLRPLAAGGMGEVWAARNELTNRDFAIKFLLPEFANHTEAFERFVREAETTGKLQHPSIVDVFDVAQTEDGQPFIVMELLSGEALEARLEREGTLSPLRTAAFFSQIATALELAHRAGVVHRDLSCGNIFLAKNDEGGEPIPKILDFGVSKTVGPEYEGRVRTCNGAVLGSPMYMSPEQAMGAETVDARTDVWSLGVLMYECLTGTVPFRSTNYNALMVEIMTRPHRPLSEIVPTADKELVSVVEQCLTKDREQRIQSALDLGDRLGEIARRLAGAEVARTPRRRATDRLPPVETVRERREARKVQNALPFGVRVWRFIQGLRIPRGVIAVAATCAGVAIGISYAGHRAATEQAQAAAEAEAAEQQELVSSKAPELPAASEEQLAEPKPLTERERFEASTQEIRLGRAMARALRGEKKER